MPSGFQLRALQAWGMNLPKEAARVHGHITLRGCLASCHTPLGQVARAVGLWAERLGLEHHISPVRPRDKSQSWQGSSAAGPRGAGGHQLLCMACTGPWSSAWLLGSPGCHLSPGAGSAPLTRHGGAQGRSLSTDVLCSPAPSRVHPGVQVKEGKRADSTGRRLPGCSDVLEDRCPRQSHCSPAVLLSRNVSSCCMASNGKTTRL